MRILKLQFIMFFMLFGFESFAENQALKEHSTAEAAIGLDNLWLRPTKGGLKVSSLYLTIQNKESETDYLLNVKTDVAVFTDIHKTVVENEISKMININKLAIPGSGKVDFKPGEIHIMLMGLKRALKVGDKVRFKFYFEKFGVIEKDALVIDK